MEKRFQEIVRRSGLGAESSVLIGVSGGLDSVVLLDLLCRQRMAGGPALQVVHVDHMIRPASGGDADFVRELCQALGVDCRVVGVDVPALAQEKRLSLETAGREARRETFLRHAADRGCAHIALAHHQDDQAETVLQRLLRGSGKSGLAAMFPLQGVWWRPLLDFTRQQILDYAKLRKLKWVEDASNADPLFLRNRIRHQLLPYLQHYNPRIKARLAALSRQFQQEEDFWQHQVAQAWPVIVLGDADGLRLDLAALRAFHPALRVRLLREGLSRVRGDLCGIESVHLDALEGLLQGQRPQAELDLPGCWAARRYENLWLRQLAPPSIEFDLRVDIGAPLLLPDGRYLAAVLSGERVAENSKQVAFDPAGIELPLQVRSPRPGDSFQPSGMQGHRKLKDYMIDMKLEKEQRQSLPLLVDRGEVLWLVGRRRSACAQVAGSGGKNLVLRLLEAADLPTKAL